MTVILLFNLWNWFLAFNGYTSIDFWNSKWFKTNPNYDFSFYTVSDNLFLIFGTNKNVRVFSPSLRNVPFTGLEWAFLMQ
jgi:hypothetical protein